MAHSRISTLVFGLFAALAAAFAADWTPETLPVPYLKDARRHVSNPDGRLTPAAVDSADALLTALERDKGVQALVAVVGRIEGDDPYAFAMALGRKYGVGSRKQRTGLIIVIATDQRSYQFLTGEGLEGTLPDALLRRIQNRVTVPALRRGDWDAALLGTLRAVDNCVRGDASLFADEDDDDLTPGEVLGVVALFGLFGAAIVFSAVYFGRRRCPRCGRRGMTTRGKQYFRDAAGRRRMHTRWRCPHCGYEDTTEGDDDRISAMPAAGPVIFGSGGGGGYTGGRFGGGTFGGGGSGGRF